MKETFVSKLLRATLYILFAAGTLVIATLPIKLDYYMIVFYDAYSIQPDYRSFILGFLIVVGVLGLCIIAELVFMLRTVPTDPFVLRNVKALRRMGIIALVTAAVFFAKCCLYITILTLIGGFLLLICGMFAFTLASLFRQAVAFKEENNLTI